MGFTLYLLYGVLVLKGSDSELFSHVWDFKALERADSMEPIQGRLWALMATVNDADTLELLEDTIALIKMNQGWPSIVPEARLSSMRFCRQNFVQWDPKVFMLGPVWPSFSFPQERDITGSEIYVFVALLFFLDKNLMDGEPFFWRELNASARLFGLKYVKIEIMVIIGNNRIL